VSAHVAEPTASERRAARKLRQLPSPPSESEKWIYLGAKRRWVHFFQAIAFGCVFMSTLRFILHVPYAEVFLIPLAISTMGYFVSICSHTQTRRDDRPSHELIVDQYQPDVWPSIDVFLPSAGESLDVLANTYRHVARLDWPGTVDVLVLDDSAREEVEYLALQHGFRYLSRPDRGHLKKAGNLKYGYDRSSGDFIAVFDADFVPRPDFIRELVPYFEDANGGRYTGIVQSPQYFDADNSMNWLQRAAGAGQEYFYRWVQPGRDRANGAICVGTSALYRRTALIRSGGFAQIGHSEDVHTGVNMNKVGYFVRYVPVILTKGLCPDELNTFINQQYRWCSGSMSLFFDRNFHQTPMPLVQKLCFWSGFLYYVSTALAVFWGPLPPIILALFVPEVVAPKNYIFVGIAMTIWYLTHPILTTGRGRRMGIARMQIVYSFAHMKALWDTARNRPADWVPSGVGGVTGGTKLATKVRIIMVSYLVFVQVALITGIVWHAPEYGWDKYWPMVVATFLNFLLVGPILHGRLRVAPFEALFTEDVDAVERTFGTTDTMPIQPAASAESTLQLQPVRRRDLRQKDTAR
jgi:cellulose synthase (UDP-forming)